MPPRINPMRAWNIHGTPRPSDALSHVPGSTSPPHRRPTGHACPTPNLIGLNRLFPAPRCPISINRSLRPGPKSKASFRAPLLHRQKREDAAVLYQPSPRTGGPGTTPAVQSRPAAAERYTPQGAGHPKHPAVVIYHRAPLAGEIRRGRSRPSPAPDDENPSPPLLQTARLEAGRTYGGPRRLPARSVPCPTAAAVAPSRMGRGAFRARAPRGPLAPSCAPCSLRTHTTPSGRAGPWDAPPHPTPPSPPERVPAKAPLSQH